MGAAPSVAAKAIHSASADELSSALAELTPEQRSKIKAAIIKSHPPPSTTLPTFPCLYPMKVIRWTSFKELGALPRSDDAETRGLLEDFEGFDSTKDGRLSCVFVSHSWWERETPKTAKPDYTSGDKANLKFRVICAGVQQMIEREALEPTHLALWVDYYSIDQIDEGKKQAGVSSMVHYTSQASFMLIPVPTENVVTDDFGPDSDPAECVAYYPEDVGGYGSRGWCRVEFFIFSLFHEMKAAYDASVQGGDGSLKLYAAGSSPHSLQQFKVVEFLGGDRGDMPSQGAFTFESDRKSIVQLENLVISAFGHAVLRRAAKSVADGDLCVDLGAKMLRDEHLATLRQLIEAGAFKTATTLSFNSISSMTTLPDLTGMDALRTLSMVNCTGLTHLPDLSGLPALNTVKLENCLRLKAPLPKLRDGIEYDDMFLPKHLRSGDADEE